MTVWYVCVCVCVLENLESKGHLEGWKSYFRQFNHISKIKGTTTKDGPSWNVVFSTLGWNLNWLVDWDKNLN